MGEGWGDWYALNHAHKSGLETTRAVVGAYATGNETRGIRNYDYNKNPTTFGDMGYDLTGPEVHADGEIWTATLWDLRKALVAKHGAGQGLRGRRPAGDRRRCRCRRRTRRSSTCATAILTADLDRYHGDNTDTIWTVFAKRGAGASAVSRHR